MYGTIARFRVRKDVDKAEFKKRMDEFDSSEIEGWIADYIFHPSLYPIVQTQKLEYQVLGIFLAQMA